MKQVSFKPVVREGVMDEQSGEPKEEEVIGEGIGKSEMHQRIIRLSVKKLCGLLDKATVTQVCCTLCSYFEFICSPRSSSLTHLGDNSIDMNVIDVDFILVI